MMKIKNWHFIIIVLFVSLIIMGIAWGMFALVYPSDTSNPSNASFINLINKWGVILGIVYTVMAAVLVAFIPSRLENQVRLITERLHRPIEKFDDLFDQALSLLISLRNNPDSVFQMVAATPILGVEIKEKKRLEWEKHFKARIESGRKTDIVCLQDDFNESNFSHLREFCKTLSRYYLEDKDKNKTNELLTFSRKEIDNFTTLATNNENFTLSRGEDPPFQLVLGNDGKGNKKGMLYFATTETIKANIPVKGFVTSDNRQFDIMERLFYYVKNNAEFSKRDLRTPLQKTRDIELLDLSEKGPSEIDYVHSLGIKIKVYKSVFPPDQEIAKDTIWNGIKNAAEKVWDDTKIKNNNRIGIDVGCGCGIYSLLLAQYGCRVIATDISNAAGVNTLENVDRFKINNPSASIEILEGNLLEPVKHIGVDDVPLIVFNHPFYPSPINAFCTGGESGGNKIIREFLESAKKIVSTGAILMPYSVIAGEHNPLTIATELGFNAKVISKHENQSYSYLFTKPAVPD